MDQLELMQRCCAASKPQRDAQDALDGASVEAEHDDGGGGAPALFILKKSGKQGQ